MAMLLQVEEYEKNEEKLRTGTSTKHYPFDFFFDKAQRMQGKQPDGNQTEIDGNQTANTDGGGSEQSKTFF